MISDGKKVQRTALKLDLFARNMGYRLTAGKPVSIFRAAGYARIISVHRPAGVGMQTTKKYLPIRHIDAICLRNRTDQTYQQQTYSLPYPSINQKSASIISNHSYKQLLVENTALP
jgi:hypothetical protein